jgi:hypothetical protein
MNNLFYFIRKYRRHLTAGQRSMAAAKALDFHIEAARERQRAAGRFDGKNEDNTPKLINVQLVASLPQAETPDPEEKKPFASNADETKPDPKPGSC